MDGVLWRSDQPIGDLPGIFAHISRGGRKVVLATNNSTLSPEQYLEKLARYGVFLEAWQIVNSSEATAQYLYQRYPEGGPVFVIGEAGLFEALEKWGFYPSEEDPRAVVMGMDRKVTYEKLRQAALFIRSGAAFIGTNADRTFPTPEGLVPGAGAILKAVEVATDVKPFVVGKPAAEMYRVALDRLGASPQETLVVGDRLETDIRGAQVLGCPAGLVLSGVTTEEQARAWTPPPDLVAADLTSLVEFLNNHANRS
jgi:4-nitrophenyl phosphatase